MIAKKLTPKHYPPQMTIASAKPSNPLPPPEPVEMDLDAALDDFLDV